MCKIDQAFIYSEGVYYLIIYNENLDKSIIKSAILHNQLH